VLIHESWTAGNHGDYTRPMYELRNPLDMLNEIRASAGKGDIGEPEHGGGKNAPHANQERKEAARERYESTKKELEDLQHKRNKTKEDKEWLERLHRQMKHLKRQVDFSGENHSQRAKGTR
jgi:hypothetical protein